MQEILTAQALWQGYDLTAEDLEVNVIKQQNIDGVVATDLYFTGRTVADGKSRVYGVVCNAESENTERHAVIVVGDYSQPIQRDVLTDFARQGFVAMSVDFAGRCEKGLGTLYPKSLDYCNADVKQDIFTVNEDMTKTWIFEYAYNLRRAITYLCSVGATKITVVTYGKGSTIGIIPLGVDERIANGVIAFGNLRLDYPTDNDQSVEVEGGALDDQLEQLDKEQAWTLALSPQTYAGLCKVPLYVIQSTNNPNLDIISASDAFRRLNPDSRLLVLPTVVMSLSKEVSANVCKWITGNTNNSSAEVAFVEENGDIYAKVVTQEALSQLELWYCNNTTHSVKFFHKVQLEERNGEYFAKLDLYDTSNSVCAFCIIKGDVDICTPVVTADVKATNLKISHGIVFSGNHRTTYVPLGDKDKWWNVDIAPQLTAGYLKIIGAKGKAMGFFSVNDPSVRKSDNSAIAFDVCCNVAQSFSVYVVCNFGTTNDVYLQQADLVGDGKWQRITVEKENFRAEEDGRLISPEQNYDVVAFVAENDFVINNVTFV